jgi:hypothetical protein
MMSRRTWLAATAVPACLLFAACGTGGTSNPSAPASSGPNAAALRTAAVAAMKQARTVRVTGSTAQGAQRVGMDVVLTRAGGVGGKISLNGHVVRLVTSPKHVYVLVTKSMSRWQKIPASACALMCGKWLQEPAADLGSLSGDAGWEKIVAAFESPLSSGNVSYAGTATVGGQPALKLNVSPAGTAFVAAHGTPYLLRLEYTGGHLDYSDWNTAALPPLPPAAKVVTVGKLKAEAAAGG